MLYDLVDFLKESLAQYSTEQGMGFFLYLPKELILNISHKLDLSSLGTCSCLKNSLASGRFCSASKVLGEVLNSDECWEFVYDALAVVPEDEPRSSDNFKSNLKRNILGPTVLPTNSSTVQHIPYPFIISILDRAATGDNWPVGIPWQATRFFLIYLRSPDCFYSRMGNKNSLSTQVKLRRRAYRRRHSGKVDPERDRHVIERLSNNILRSLFFLDLRFCC